MNWQLLSILGLLLVFRRHWKSFSYDAWQSRHLDFTNIATAFGLLLRQCKEDLFESRKMCCENKGSGQTLFCLWDCLETVCMSLMSTVGWEHSRTPEKKLGWAHVPCEGIQSVGWHSETSGLQKLTGTYPILSRYLNTMGRETVQTTALLAGAVYYTEMSSSTLKMLNISSGPSSGGSGQPQPNIFLIVKHPFPFYLQVLLCFELLPGLLVLAGLSFVFSFIYSFIE